MMSYAISQRLTIPTGSYGKPWNVLFACFIARGFGLLLTLSSLEKSFCPGWDDMEWDFLVGLWGTLLIACGYVAYLSASYTMRLIVEVGVLFVGIFVLYVIWRKG